MRKGLRMRVEGPDEFRKHTFVVEPMDMDMQISPDRSSEACEQKQAKQTSDLSQTGGGIAKAMRGMVKEPMENACECY